MMSFIGEDLPRLGSRQYPKAWPRSCERPCGPPPVPAPAGRVSIENATPPTPHRPGSIRPGALRAGRGATWAKLAFALLCIGALIGYFAFPTYPTYDSFYALLWGRDLLHGHLPDFRVYRGPTEHPLAIAFGMFCSIFGQGGARLMVLGSIGSFVALVVGMYRLRRRGVGPAVGVVR